MKVEIVANGTVSFALIPENDMDRAAMKMLLKQNNEFVEITKQTQILNKASFTEGLVIQPKAREDRQTGVQIELTGNNKLSSANSVSPAGISGKVEMEYRGSGIGAQIGDTPINE
jgi:hypothetical protein